MNINKLYISLLLVAMTLFSGCKYDDLQDDVDALKDRVTLLEEQVKLLNENLDVISYMFDGKLAISDCKKNGSESYTLTFTNGETLTLNLGSESSVRLPEMQIVDGKWVIEGIETDIPVSNDVQGQDGKTPKFKLELDEIQNKYYWSVSTDGGMSYESVKDDKGQVVYVTVDDKLPSDPNFATAGLSQDGKFFVLQYKDGDSIKELKVAVVEDLSCKLDYAFGKTARVITGKSVMVTAEIQGDSYFVNAPKGWTVKTGTLSEAGELNIELTAPAAKISRADADNLTDLSVMVNKGNFWAVDKMTLEVIDETEATIPEQYMCGVELNIDGATFSFKKNGAPMVVSEDAVIENTDAKKYQVFMIGAGKTLTVKPQVYQDGGKTKYRGYYSDNIVFVSLDEHNPGTVKFLEFAFVGMNPTATSEAYIAAKNVNLDTSESNKYMMTTSTKTEKMHVKIIDCRLNLCDQPLTYLNTPHYFDTFDVKNCDIRYESSAALKTLMNFGSSLTGFGDMTFNNNVIYCSNGNKASYKIINAKKSANASFGKMECMNNTFINLEPNDEGYYIMKEAASIKFSKNLIWSDEQKETDNFIIVYNGPSPAAQAGEAVDNICYSTSNWTLFNGKNLISGSKEIEKLTTDPFTGDGAQFDKSKGIFVPNSTYAGYGATR